MSDPTWDPVDLTVDDLDYENPDEQMGSKDKNWVHVHGDDRPWLVKLARPAAADGVIAGEDWAEWLVQHFAAMLGVPTAVVRPATFDGARASASRRMLADSAEWLEHGNSLLAGAFPAYVQAIKSANPDYTPANVRVALDRVAPPSGVAALADFTAYDVWAGYLAMDAWLAGQDRHDENWAAVRRGEEAWLAPSFDHGNALGFLLRDDERIRRLSSPDGVEAWAARGRSRHFAGTPSLLALAQDALGHASARARAYWLDQLDAVDLFRVASIVALVPDERMTEVAGTFVVRLLEINRRRLLDGYRSA